MRRTVVVSLAVLLVGASCGSGRDSTAEGSKAAPAAGSETAARVGSGIDGPGAPPTVVDRILAGQRTDELSLEASLQLFAVAFGPLPGVTVPDGPSGHLVSGTLALQGVTDHWTELTDAQRSAVVERSGEHPGAADPAGHGRSARRPADDPDGPGAAAFRPSLDETIRLMADQLGPLGGTAEPVHVQLMVEIPDAADPIAEAHAWTSTVRRDLCRVTVNPIRMRDLRGPSLVLAHELFHCYQLFWRDGRRGQPLWVREGLANWVAAAVVAGHGGSDGGVLTPMYRQFQDSPGRSLADRAYDAVGFFSLANQSSPGLMGRVQQITSTDSTATAYADTVNGSADVVDHWGPRQFDVSSWGADWDLTGPEVPDLAVPAPRGEYAPLGNGATLELRSEPLATRRGGIAVRSEIAQIDVGAGTGGVVRHGAADDRLASISGQWCTGSACVCPPDTAQAGRNFPRLTDADHLSMAIAGGSGPGLLTIRGRSLRDVCGERPQCYVGRFRMQPVSSASFDTRSGGDGATLDVGADGDFTIDLSTMAEWVASPTVDPTMENRVRFGGRVTGHLDLPATPDGTASITGWDSTGVTGNVQAFLNGQLVMTMDEETARQFATAAFGNPSGSWTVTPCSGAGFTFSNSGISFVWVPA